MLNWLIAVKCCLLHFLKLCLFVYSFLWSQGIVLFDFLWLWCEWVMFDVKCLALFILCADKCIRHRQLRHWTHYNSLFLWMHKFASDCNKGLIIAACLFYARWFFNNNTISVFCCSCWLFPNWNICSTFIYQLHDPHFSGYGSETFYVLSSKNWSVSTLFIQFRFKPSLVCSCTWIYACNVFPRKLLVFFFN